MQLTVMEHISMFPLRPGKRQSQPLAKTFSLGRVCFDDKSPGADSSSFYLLCQ
jgi:hypothetical protein